MNSTINQRLKELIKFLIDNKKVYNQKDFADKIGKSKTQLSEMLKGTLVISERTVHAISTAFPKLNPSWLITGEGNMFAEKDEINQTKNDMTQEKFFDALERRDKQFDELLEQNSRLISVIENMTGTPIKQSRVG